MKIKKTEMTEGPILKSMLLFSFPLILTQLMQTMFNMADQVVLGQMAGTDAVASVGACSIICSLVVSLFCGLAGGNNVVLARYAGSKDDEKIRTTVSTVMIASLFLGLTALVVGLLFARSLLVATNCPPDCLEGSFLYLMIYFSSMPAMLIYQFGASVLRVSGDSKRPLFYLMIAGALNVVLNVIFCLILKQKVAAVAIATLSTQVIGAALVLRRLFRSEDCFSLSLKHLRFDFQIFVKVLRYGIPCALNSCMYSLAGLQIQSAINSFGKHATAGNSAASGIEGLIGSFTGSFSTACLTFLGQNIGADNKERVKKIIRNSITLAPLFCGSLALIVYLFRRSIIGLYVPGDLAAIAYGSIRMDTIFRFYIVSAVNQILSAILQAFGYSSIVFYDSVISVLVFRVIWMTFVYPRYQTFENLILCYFISWLLVMVTYAMFSLWAYRRYQNGKGRSI